MEILSILIRNLTDMNEELTYSQFNKTFMQEIKRLKKFQFIRTFYLKINLLFLSLILAEGSR